MRQITRPDELFDFTDKTVKVYLKRLIKDYSALARKVNALPFDELNALAISSSVSGSYDDIEQQAFIIFCLIYARVYKLFHKDGYRGSMEKALVTALLEDYNAVTKYIYTSECDRKRARLFEAIMGAIEASKTAAAARSQVKAEIETARNLFARQVEQYADQMTVSAMLQAYKDAGVERVMWHSFEDNRVCATCESFNGKIFTLEDLPPLPNHYHCRCWVTPVK